MCQNYNVARNTKRWPMVIVYNLLHSDAINAHCIYKANNTDDIKPKKNKNKNDRVFTKRATGKYG